MFKKNISVVNSRPLSGKDAKKLRTDVEAAFPALSEDDLKVLLPPKAEITLAKLSNKSSVYSVSIDAAGQAANPLFFDPDRGVLYPTVYALWRCPNLLPTLQTYSEVSTKVLGGADLFLAGIIPPPSGLPVFAAGDAMAVQIPENAFGFAVGVMECSSATAQKSGLKGRGLRLLHHYPDQLWALGDKTCPDGFTPTRVFAKEQSTESGSGAAEQPAPAHSADSADNAADTLQALSLSPVETAQVDTADPVPSSAPAAVEMTSDEAIEYCLLAGLHSVSDADLPMMTSDFYSRHMLTNAPQGVAVDIKKSSYKQLSKLLKAFEKKGLLKQKLVRKQEHLASVDRSHDLYTHFARQESNGAATDVEAPASSGCTQQSAVQIQVTPAYRVPSSLRPIFGAAAGADKERLYSAEEVAAALQHYASQQELQPGGGGGSLVLDKLLVGGLFNKKEPQQEGDEQPLDDVLQRLLGKLLLYHKVKRTTSEGSLEVVKRGSIKNIHVACEDRAGGRKHITRITGLESFAIDPDELASILQKKFSASSSVQKLPGKTETGKEIALQGNVLVEVGEFLQKDYGIAAGYIELKSKCKG